MLVSKGEYDMVAPGLPMRVMAGPKHPSPSCLCRSQSATAISIGFAHISWILWNDLHIMATSVFASVRPIDPVAEGASGCKLRCRISEVRDPRTMTMNRQSLYSYNPLESYVILVLELWLILLISRLTAVPRYTKPVAAISPYLASSGSVPRSPST